MFGNLNKPTFGSTAPSTSFGFGAAATTANPFGQTQNLFNKPATGAFGTTPTSTFGQPAGTLFPSTQPQQTNLFQNANTSFGTGTSGTTTFGSNLFGQQQQPTTVGLFNTPSTTAFGQQNKPTGFGFGTQQAQPSLFGTQQQPTTNIFQPSTTSLFSGTSAFGGQQTGTVIKFTPVTGTDTMMKNGVAQSINTKHHSITCMKEYEKKSFEELRYEDYEANRKGPQQQQTGFGAAPFGSTNTSTTSLFGQSANKPGQFGQTPGFGQTTTPFGQTTGFGLTGQQNTASPFGAKPTAFGVPTSSAFGFGSPQQNANLFGATNVAKPFSSTAQPIFSTNTTQPTTTGFGTGLFGTNTQNTGASLFNKPAQPAPAFGTTGGTTGFAFNTPASTQSTNLFSNTSKPLFGGTSTTPGFGTSTFGTAQPGFGSTFGKPTATPFGVPQANTFGTSLGVMPNQGSSLFGTNTQNKPGGGLFNTGTTGLFSSSLPNFQSGTGFGLGQQQQPQQMLFAQQEQQPTSNLALLTNGPFGDAPHLAGLEPKLKSNMHASVSATDPKELKSLLDASKKVDMSHNSKLKVTPFKSVKNSLFEGIPKSNETSKQAVTENVKNSCRRLVLKPRQPADASQGFLRSDLLENVIEDKENRSINGKKFLHASLNNPDLKANTLRLNFETSHNDSSVLNNSIETQTYNNVVNNSITDTFLDAKDTSPSPPSNANENVDILATGDNKPNKYPCGITCTRPEYYTLPSVEELTQYVDENGACIVKGFTIGRKGYGNVYFPDEMDVFGLNIDELVHFRYREINVYPDDSKKPPVGQGLNRRAQVTLDNVYPRKSGTNSLVKNVGELLQMNFSEKLRKVTEKKGARFVDYRPETGSWVFKVDHFSKYGYNDSDEENDQNNLKSAPKPSSENPPQLIQTVQGKEFETNKEQITDVNLATETSMFGLGLDKDILIDSDSDLCNQEDISRYIDEMSENDSYHRRLSSHPVAMDTLYDSYFQRKSKNVQVMKSTLFAQDDDRSSDGAGSHISILKQYLDLPEDLPTRLPTLTEEMSTPSLKKRPVLRPKVYEVLNFGGEVRNLTALLPSRCYMDLSLFMGKSLRVGWGKGVEFYGVSEDYRQELVKSTLEKGESFDALKDVLTDCLQVVLEESCLELSESRVPTFQILKNGLYLQRQTELFESLIKHYSNSKEVGYLYSIWTLCTALWGPGENSVHSRRYLLSEWLKINTSNGDTSLKTLSSVTDVANAIFTSLSVFKVFQAVTIAIDNKFPNLSLIMSQLSLTNTSKMFLQEQIENWYTSLTSQHISIELKRIYLVLAGIPVRDEVNVFKDVDWKRAFGMHLWYICQNGAPIEMVIEHYKKAYEELGYAEGPNPPYLKEFGTESNACDILYHILMLYKTNAHRLSSVLNPATHTADPLDYRLSWLLLQLFSSLEVGIIETSELNKLCTSFSNQLEDLGLWEWAIFVLLYIGDDSVKKSLIIGILDRNITLKSTNESQEKIENIVNNMQVPPQWIHQVKAEKSLFSQKYFEAFNHFALAQNYVKANEILIEHLLPNLFINEQYDLIKTLIESIQENSKNILRWSNEAGLFYEFLELQERVITSKPEVIIKLQTQLNSISDRLAGFPLKNDQQKLCIAELSKRCATLYKELAKNSKSSLYGDTYMHFIEALIMPPDFKHSEGMYLISDFQNFRLNRQ